MRHGEVTQAQLQRVALQGERYKLYLRTWTFLIFGVLATIAAFCFGVYLGTNTDIGRIWHKEKLHHAQREPPVP